MTGLISLVRWLAPRGSGAVGGMLPAASIAAAMLCIAAASTSAHAQSPALDGRLDARTRVSIQRLVDSAQAAGLPGEPLVLKALEGASKGADGARITLAVRRLAVTLGDARQALGPSSGAAEIVAGASALQAGVPGAVLKDVRAARADRPVGAALSVLTDLVVAGVPLEVARDAVLALVRGGATDEQLLSFQRQVGFDIQAGKPPLAAVSGARQSVPVTVPAGTGGGRPGLRTPGTPPSYP